MWKEECLMVPGRFLNVFGSDSDFVDGDSYQVCLDLLQIFHVMNGGN